MGLRLSRYGNMALLCALTWAFVGGCSSSDTPDQVVSPLITKNPFETPKDRLEGTSQTACTQYETERCEAGRQQRCAVYDTDSQSFVQPSELFRRVLRYERRYEQYHSPEGLTTTRVFTATTPPEMLEEEWGALDHFSSHSGRGDSAIWTGTALNGFILRYLQTGSEADYQRMETKVRQFLRLFDVTDIEGYLARYYYYDMPDGGPKDDTHLFTYGDDVNHTHRVMRDPGAVEGLDAVYSMGPEDNGQRAQGTAMWNGVPSIDQYSGATVSLPAAWGLLRDQTLKDRIARHMTCYLKRLGRLEIRNIQSNPDAVAAIVAFLDTSGAQLESSDADLTQLNNIVVYYHAQLNVKSEPTFDDSCPATVRTEANRVIDARDGDFLTQVLALTRDLDAKKIERVDTIDHFYAPNVRPQDAVHMLGLAAIAYHMTGDLQYKDFFEKTLLEDMNAAQVAKTFGQFIAPKWCRKFYEAHISIAPLWAFLNLLDDSSTLKQPMKELMHVGAWSRDASKLGNAKYAFMFSGAARGAGEGHDAAAAEGKALLTSLGGFHGRLDDPRRSYSIDYSTVATSASSIERQCPTAEQVDYCETGPVLFGIPIGGQNITFDCTGAEGECELGDGRCAAPMSTTAVPVGVRPWSGFLWQRNPFQMGVNYPIEGQRQSPGVDLFESYWLGRHYGNFPEDEGQVLAWEDVGTCN